MKVFFSTLSAILVAAVIIWFVFAAYQTHQARLKWDAEMRQMNEDSESRKAFWEWSEQRDKNPQSPPSAEKLTARLREIREASENNRPIPPSPWQTPETPTTNNAQSQQPAPEIQAPPGLGYVILTRDVEVSRGTKKIVIPKDSKLLSLVAARAPSEFAFKTRWKPFQNPTRANPNEIHCRFLNAE